jgi:hypothetical protein
VAICSTPGSGLQFRAWNRTGPESKIQNLKSKIVLSFLLACLLVARSAAGQQAGNVILDGNEQLFCVLAALNAAGYDSGLGIETGNKTREQVRAALARENYPALADLKKFYAEHQVASDAAADLGQYISLALLLGPPPDFKPTVPQKDLPPDAKAVAGLIPLLKRFYQEGNLADLWARVQPRFQAEVLRYSDPVRNSVTLSDAYLRFPSGAYMGRTYNIYLSLLAAPNQVQARIYGLNYYLVVTPSKELKLAEIRHQYLHFLLDGLALKYAVEIHQKEGLLGRLFPAGHRVPDPRRRAANGQTPEGRSREERRGAGGRRTDPGALSLPGPGRLRAAGWSDEPVL